MDKSVLRVCIYTCDETIRTYVCTSTHIDVKAIFSSTLQETLQKILISASILREWSATDSISLVHYEGDEFH